MFSNLPQFVDPSRGAVVGQILLLGVLFALMATCTDGLYALLGSMVGRWLNKSRLVQQWQRYITGCIYILHLSALFASESVGACYSIIREISDTPLLMRRGAALH